MREKEFDDAKAVLGRNGDEQTAIVGPEIEGGVGALLYRKRGARLGGGSRLRRDR